MNLGVIDWIWHVKGRLALLPGQSGSEAFDKLDPLFRQVGTAHQRTDNKIVFRKKDQAAQDKMAVFDSGELRIYDDGAAVILSYDLVSRAMLFCFLAPLFFLGAAQTTILISRFDKPPHEAAKKHPVHALNPIDKALGAPAPEDPEKKKKGESDQDKDKLKPTAAYVMAAIFATLYIIGRILEDRLVKRLFKKQLLEP